MPERSRLKFRLRTGSCLGFGLVLGALLACPASAQVVVGNGEYYDGNGAPVTIDVINTPAITATSGSEIKLVTQPVHLTTSGNGSYYGLRLSGSTVTIGVEGSANTIRTTGNNAHGIVSSNSTIMLTGMSITTGGTRAYGLSSYQDNVTLTDVTIRTDGDKEADGIDMSDSTLRMIGGSVTTSGSARGLYLWKTNATLENVDIVAAAGYGVNIGGGGTFTMTGGSITSGSSRGIHVQGTSTAVAEAFLTGVTVKATGEDAVEGYLWSKVTIANSNITSYGNSALILLSSVGTVTGSYLLADLDSTGAGRRGIQIDTTGVLHMTDSTAENYGNAYGIWHITGNAAPSTITNSRIITHGSQAKGLVVQGFTDTTLSASQMTMSGGSIHTYGNSANGAEVLGEQTGSKSPRLVLSNNIEIVTEGVSSHGILTDQRGIIVGTDVTILTKGANAMAVRAIGGSISLTDAVIRTEGDRAVGVLSDNSNTKNYGTIVSLTGVNILTRGQEAHGAQVAFGGRMALDGVAVETRGVDAAGFYFLGTNAQSHNVTIDNSSFTALSGPGVLVRGAANRLTLNNTSIVSEGGTLFNVRRRLVPGSDPGVPDDANPGRLTVIANGGSFKGAARPDDLSTLHFSLSNGSWTITTAAADSFPPSSDLPLNTSRLNILLLESSTVSFAREGGFKVLRADTLRGNNTLFEMNTDLGAGAGDFMSFGTAEGDHRLMVRNTGGEPGADGQHLRLISVVDPATAATFTLANTGGVVDAGTYRYTLVQEDNTAIGGDANNWALLNTSRLDPPPGPGPGPTPPPPPPGPAPVDPAPKDLSTTANAAINTGDGGTAQSIWYAEMNSLSKRLGELRLGNDEGGLWGRTFARGQKIDNRLGRGFDQTIGGLEIGLDGGVDVSGGRWYLGGVAGYSHADRDFSFNEGKGKTDSYHVGAYATFIGDNGFYLDTIGKLNHMQNDYHVIATDGMRVDGDYSNAAMGLSFETGWRFKLQDGWFLEPQAELILYRAEGAEYRTSNGMQVRVGMANSAQLRTSMMIGRLIELSENRVIQPYVKLGWIQEFAGSSTVWTNGIAHKSKLEGGRFDLDVGIMANLGKNHRLYADYGYASGSRLKEPWSLNVGYRYAW